MISSESAAMQEAHTYTDMSGMSKLRRLADTDREKALEGVARQFESLFLQQMMKAMRSANEVFAEGNYLNSQETQHYQDMFDKQLTLSLTKNDSIGIADAIVQQLGGGNSSPAANVGGEPKTSISDYDRTMPSPSPELPERVKDVAELMDETRSDEGSSEALPQRFESPQSFVSKLQPIADRVSEDSGVPSRVMLAQAALETGWGSKMIEGDQQQPSHNLFGIKADQRWSGESVTVGTTEYRDGVKLHEDAAFRAYSDYEASFRDYASFLKQNPRYEQVLEKADDPKAFADALQDAGYATDPAYGRKIRGIMDGPVIRSALDGDTKGSDGS